MKKPVIRFGIKEDRKKKKWVFTIVIIFQYKDGGQEIITPFVERYEFDSFEELVGFISGGKISIVNWVWTSKKDSMK